MNRVPAAAAMLSVWFRRDDQQTNGPPSKEEVEDKLRDITDRRLDAREADFRVPGGVVHTRVGRTEQRSSGRPFHYSEKSNGVYFVREMLNDGHIERIMQQKLYPPSHITVPITDGEIDGMHYTKFFLRGGRIRANRTSGYDNDHFALSDGFRHSCSVLESRMLANAANSTTLYGETPETLNGFLDDTEEHMREVSQSVRTRGGADEDIGAGVDIGRLARVVRAYCIHGPTAGSAHVHVFLGHTEFLAVLSPTSGVRSLYMTSGRYMEDPKYTEEMERMSDDLEGAAFQPYKDVYGTATAHYTRRRIDPTALEGIRSHGRRRRRHVSEEAREVL